MDVHNNKFKEVLINDFDKNDKQMGPALNEHPELTLLKKYFSEYFTQDVFDFDRFKATLTNQHIVLGAEGHGLNFLGKSYARYKLSEETKTVITPDEKHNSLPENKNSNNIYITGDNLDALHHLLNAYSGKIKCIYIDPPYNTGGDGFIYADKFAYTPEKLATILDISEDEATRIIKMKGKNHHSAWLTFIYPRLFLAKQLLSEDGVIFISIDDNEVANLRTICDTEIFGEENFVAQIIVQSNPGGQQYLKVARSHEYVLMYTKNADTLISEIEKPTELKYVDNIGKFDITDLRNRNPKFGKINRKNLYYPIYINPNKPDNDGFFPVSLIKSKEYSIEVLPLDSKGRESLWRWGKKKFEQNNNESSTLMSNIVGRLKKNGKYDISVKSRKVTTKAKTILFEDLFETDLISEFGDIFAEKEVITEKGTKELETLGLRQMFDFPKPTYLVEKLLSIATDENSIILDFFSGSGTTAVAVMKMNAADAGKRICISVQYPENLDEKYENAPNSEKPKIQDVISFLDSIKKPHLLSEVGIERIKRSAQNIKYDSGEDIDYGFRLFTLNELQGTQLDRMETFNPDECLAYDSFIEQYKFGQNSGVSTILQTWKVQDGYDFLAEPIEIDLGGYPAYYLSGLVGNTIYLIDDGITNQNCKRLIEILENQDYQVNKVVLFAYVFPYARLEEIKRNLSNMKIGSSIIPVIERF